MSIASSHASEISVSFHGKEVSLEEAIDSTMTNIQNYLNKLQQALRCLAMIPDQECGDDVFKASVEMELEINEFVDAICDCADELTPIAAEIRGPAPPSCKEWYKHYLADLKAKKTRDKLNAKAAKDSAKAAAAAENPSK